MMSTRKYADSERNVSGGGGATELLDSASPVEDLSAASIAAAVVEEKARIRLWESGSYAFEFRRIRIHFRDGCLTLQGKLPSFHLKQLLQTRLRGLPGVTRIANQVEVVGHVGQPD